MTAIAVIAGILAFLGLYSLNTFYLKPRREKVAAERSRAKAELEAERPSLVERCAELFEKLKTKRGYFLIWRAPDVSFDFQKEEEYLQEHFWDGAEGRVVVKRRYERSAEYTVGKYEPDASRIATWILREYSKSLPQVVA